MGELPARAGREDEAEPILRRAYDLGVDAETASTQELTLERVVRPAGPFSLALCTKHASDATRQLRDGTLTTTLRVGERVEIGSARQTRRRPRRAARRERGGPRAAALRPRRRRRPLGVPAPLRARPADRRGDDAVPGDAPAATADGRAGAAARLLRPADRLAARAPARGASSSARVEPRVDGHGSARAADVRDRSRGSHRRGCASSGCTLAAPPRSCASAARSTSSGCTRCRPRRRRHFIERQRGPRAVVGGRRLPRRARPQRARAGRRPHARSS